MEQPYNAKVKEFIKHLASALQFAKIYTIEHTKAIDALQGLYKELEALVQERKAVVFGLLGNELFSEGDIFFDLTTSVKDFIKDLQAKNIQKIYFGPGVTQEELAKFLEEVSATKLSSAEEIEKRLLSRGIQSISVDVLRIEAQQQEVAGGGQVGHVDLPFVGMMYQQIVNRTTQMLDEAFLKQIDNLHSFIDIVCTIFEVLAKKENVLSMFMNLKTHDDYTLVHCVNVSILTMLQARALGLSKQQILESGVAGFMHDIGKIAVARHILQKPSSLTDEEFSAVKSHTILGAKILLHFGKLSKVTPLAAFEHHLGFMVAGYPATPFKRKPVLVSLLVTISDIYDALRSRRSYKKLVSPEKVYEIMEKERGRVLDPALFDNFIRIVGVWPVGSIVQLTTGEIGVVEKIHSSDIRKPNVKIFYAELSKKIEKPFSVDLRSDTNRSIQISLGADENEITQSITQELLRKVS